MKSFISIIFTCTFFVANPLSISGQGFGKSLFNYDKYGNVKSVEFSDSDKEYDYNKSVDVFFRDVLKVKANDSFVKNKMIRLDDGNETFEQYYKGINVENAGYTFHYDEKGSIRYAHGNYINVSDVDTNPTISKEDASKAFARYIGISPDSITQYSAELIIKNVKGERAVEIPLLVYKVFIETSNACITDYGYVDAKTGNVVKTESSINFWATGTFHTKYYGTKYATTNCNGVNYLLNDPTRGNGIETKDLQNHNIYQINNAIFLADYDNNWYYSDYADSTFMAFDVHWALQKIYDRLYYVHGKNSFDNNGKKIMAYVRALIPDGSGGYNSDNSCWNNTKEALFFGEGDGYNRPVSALDVVAHEYGHGISHYQIGWTHDEDFLNEGLSDIWGAIMDCRFGDNNAEVWEIGEHIPSSYKTCIRNISYPPSISAEHPMASTYNSSWYHFYNSINDSYGMSGVFSHWFYLLVNGGCDTNENGTYYNLSPVGMDVAENLIVKAVYDNYLRYTTSYEDLRQAFIWAARSMNISGLETAVCNAWYAVGVGDMGLSLTGPSHTSSQSIYSVNGLPNGFNVDWSLSDSFYNQNCLQQNYPSPNQCTITRSSIQDMMSDTLTAAIKHNGITVQTLTRTGISAFTGFKGTYISSDMGNGQYVAPNPIFTGSNSSVHIWSPRLVGATVTYTGDATPSYWLVGYNTIDVNMPSTGSTILIHVVCEAGDDYYIPVIRSTPPYYLSVNFDGEAMIVTLDDSALDNRDWILEIYNVMNGEEVVTQNVTSNSVTINISGWKRGLYAARVTIGKEVLTEKVVVR